MLAFKSLSLAFSSSGDSSIIITVVIVKCYARMRNRFISACAVSKKHRRIMINGQKVKTTILCMFLIFSFFKCLYVLVYFVVYYPPVMVNKDFEKKFLQKFSRG